MRKNKIDVITLGCSKNLVDSEMLMKQLIFHGYTVEHDPNEINGEIVVVNTCGFIEAAKEESINMILSIVAAKNERKTKKIFVMGCLSERYLEELKSELPEVDKFYGKFGWKALLADLGKSYNSDIEKERNITTPQHYAFLKISEGCNRKCSYCSIPLMTGKHNSRPIEEIVEEVQWLVSQGVKEFQIIAQDLTYYGIDRYKENKLAELIDKIAKIPGVEWIRLHYAYPAQFPIELLKVIRENKNVCNYLDLALQHISDPMLSAMRRAINKKDTINLLEKIRKEVPGIHLRTTLIVGHPNETDEDFDELLDFVKTQKFERLGAFPYSHEEGTYAFDNYEDNVSPDVKQERLNLLMETQEKISLTHNEEKIGLILRVIVDKIEGNYYIGRSEFDSPEVDPEILIKKEDNLELNIGDFYNVIVTEAMPFDLVAKVI